MTSMFCFLSFSPIVKISYGESSSLNVKKSNGYRGVILYMGPITYTGIECAWAARAIIYAPVCVTRPPFAMIACVPMITLLTLDMRANTAASGISVVLIPHFSARVLAVAYPV